MKQSRRRSNDSRSRILMGPRFCDRSVCDGKIVSRGTFEMKLSLSSNILLGKLGGHSA